MATSLTQDSVEGRCAGVSSHFADSYHARFLPARASRNATATRCILGTFGTLRRTAAQHNITQPRYNWFETPRGPLMIAS